VFDIGSSLRDARERQALDFPELEGRTKIRPKYLRALEDERFDILPAPTYVKGFLRSYAEALGLDGQPFVDEYNSRFASVGEDEPVLITRRVPTRRPESGRRGTSRLATVALLGIAIVTALVIVAWRFGGPSEGKVPGLAGSDQTQRSLAGSRVNLLVRAAGGSSWMEVRTGSTGGRLLYSGTLERGQQKRFHGRTLRLSVAEPQYVTVRLNGDRVDLPAGSAFVITSQHIARASS
jgi:hypothetical protein